MIVRETDMNLDAIYLHDDQFISLNFDLATKSVIMLIKEHVAPHRVYEVEFHQVLGYSLTACDYWGLDDRISCFYKRVSSEREYIPALEKHWVTMPVIPPVTEAPSYADYAEFVMDFISGDRLIVACKEIVVPDFKQLKNYKR